MSIRSKSTTLMAALLLLGSSQGMAGTVPDYRLERVWPVLQQPWYFTELNNIAIDRSGFIYLVETDLNLVKKFSTTGRQVTAWGGPGSNPGQFNAPVAIAVDSRGYVYVGDVGNGVIQKFTANGEFVLEFGRGLLPRADARDLTFDAFDNLFVGGFFGVQNVSRFRPPADGDPNSPHQRDLIWGSLGSGPGEFRDTQGIGIDSSGFVYVADFNNKRIQKFTFDGVYDSEWGTAGTGQGQFGESGPQGIQINANDEILVGDNPRVQVFDSNGVFLRQVDNFAAIRFVLDAQGNLIAHTIDTVRQLTPGGEENFVWRAANLAPGFFELPKDTAVDSQGFIYVPDTMCRVQKFDAEFILLSVWNLCALGTGLTVGDNDRLFFSEGTSIVGFDPPASGVITDPHEEQIRFGMPASQSKLIAFAANDVSDTSTELVGLFDLAELGNVSTDNLVSLSLVLGDVNADFRPDLIIGTNGVNRIYLNDVNDNLGLTLLPGVDIGTQSGTTKSAVLTDIDGDGDLDLATANTDAPNRLYRNNGSGVFTLIGNLGSIAVGNNVILAGDVDKDGDEDLFVGNTGSNQLFLNDGAGNFSEDMQFPGGSALTNGATFIDQDKDGDLDLALANTGVNQYLSNENGVFAVPANLTDDDFDSRGIAAIDLNFDGLPDVAVANFNQVNRSYLNNSGGTFFSGEDYDDRSGPTTSVAVAYSRQTDPSVLFGNLGSPNVYYKVTDSNTEKEFGGATSMTHALAVGLLGNLDPQGLLAPRDVAIGPSGLLYVADGDAVKKFTQDGTFVSATRHERVPGAASFEPSRIALDSNENLFVANGYGRDILKFNAPANPASSDPHQFALDLRENAVDVAVNSLDQVLLVDGMQRVVGVYDQQLQQVGQIGERGIAPGNFERPHRVSVAPDGRVLVSEDQLARVHVFTPQPAAQRSKAIIVAGGGPYPGNALWDATQINANFAYRVLLSQGFGSDDIFYISDNTTLDLSGNNLPDVDAAATTVNLRNAFTNFATGAEDLVVYVVDHGGLDTFRMSGTEVLAASTFGQMINDWQQGSNGARATIIYDACQSGSFMNELSSNSFDRVVITSAQEGESAYFVSQGTLSFSNHFWTHIFNGLSVGDAYDLASAAQSTTFVNQTPLLDADGDGNHNTAADQLTADNLFIGNANVVSGDAPLIGTVPAVPDIMNGSTATISALNVTDTDQLARVWAILRPPGFNPGSPDNPVQNLPTLELQRNPASDDYQLIHDGFTVDGTYQVTVFAEDRLGNTAVPQQTFVTVNDPLRRRAIVITGGDSLDNNYPGRSSGAGRAFKALDQQGYGDSGAMCTGSGTCDQVCDNICYLTNAGASGQDLGPTLANLTEAITLWGTDQVRDLTLYLTAETDFSGGYRINATESVTAAGLKSMLDTAQLANGGTITLVIDADDGQSLIEQLAPVSGQRILISSTGIGERARFIANGRVSFSKFFWNQVLNGATVRQAFRLAEQAIGFIVRTQHPQLDDSGNGMSNEIFDGLVARNYAIGSGVLLAGDDPLVSEPIVNAALVDNFETIGVASVTSTGPIDTTLAIVTRPGGEEITQPLARRNGGYSDRSYALCADAGDYDVSIVAIDNDGNASQPAITTVNRATECTEFLFFAGFE